MKYREVFDVELSKGNSSIITQVSTLLQLIKSNSQVSQKVNTVDELADFYIEMSKK